MKSKQKSISRIEKHLVTIEQISKKLSDAPFGTQLKSIDYTEIGIPIIQGRNIVKNKFQWNKKLYTSKEKFDALPRSHCSKGDLIFPKIGTIGHVCILPTVERHEQCILSTNSMSCSINEKLADPNYVYYYFCQKKIYDYIQATCRGSTQPIFNFGMLKIFPIEIPSLEIQFKIAKILSDLDTKIDNLQNQNRILEQTAQTIFKSWFVDFDGVTEFEDSELGQIPKGWSITDLKSVLSLRKDGSHNPPKRVEVGIPFIAGASDVKHFVVDFSNCSFITQIDYEAIHKNWEIKTNDVLLTIVGTIGNVAIVTQNDLPFSLQRSLAVLRPNEKIDFAFLYFLLTSIQFEQFLYANLNPTGQPGIYLGTLGGFKFILPPKPLIEKFFDVSEKIILIIQKNYISIDHLTKTRDALLPKLMSGEIRV